jgi:hypothetical protein
MTGVVSGYVLSNAASSSIFSLIILFAGKNMTSLTVLGIGLVAGIRI